MSCLTWKRCQIFLKSNRSKIIKKSRIKKRLVRLNLVTIFCKKRSTQPWSWLGTSFDIWFRLVKCCFFRYVVTANVYSSNDWNSMFVSTFTSMYPLGRCTKSSRLIDYYLDSLRSVTPTTQPSRITRQENTARAPQRLGPISAEQLGLASPNRGSILLAKVCII